MRVTADKLCRNKHFNKQQIISTIISTDSREGNSCTKEENENLAAVVSERFGRCNFDEAFPETWMKVNKSRKKSRSKKTDNNTFAVGQMMTKREENLDNSFEGNSSDHSEYNSEGTKYNVSSDAQSSVGSSNEICTDMEHSDASRRSRSECSTLSEESTHNISAGVQNFERTTFEKPDEIKHSENEDSNASSADYLLQENVVDERNKRKRYKRTKNINKLEVVMTNCSTSWDELSVQLAKHTTPNCSVTNIKIDKQIAEGKRVCLTYKGEQCPWRAVVLSTPKEENNSLDINEALVLGATNSGIGYTQMKKLLDATGIACMNNSIYRKCRDKSCTVLWKTLCQNMKKAGKQVLEEAIASGNVKNGIGLITVLADGSWMKRSYKTGSFNSPPGMVFIVGQKTRKILWIEIKDMYCSVCDRPKVRNGTPKSHTCFKNWSREQSSSSMESVAIAEEFQKSIEHHNLIYCRLIADGHSSVHKRIQEVDSYAEHGVEVQKIECSKHLRRAFKNKVKEMGTNKRGQTGRTRKDFLASGPKCIADS